MIERLLGVPNEARDEAFSDLAMMIGPGGQERSRAQFEALFGASGYRLTGITSPESSHCRHRGHVRVSS